MSAAMQEQKDLLKSLIDITQTHDKEVMTERLVNAISALTHTEQVYYFQVPLGHDQDCLELISTHPQDSTLAHYNTLPFNLGRPRITLDDSLVACIESQSITNSSMNARQRISFPVVVNEKLIGVVDTFSDTSNTKNENLIQHIIHIYSNFLSIIDDNQRDTLTGLLNRKTFESELSALLSLSNNTPNPQTDHERRHATTEGLHDWMGILDIDHFKSINDQYGHVYGDEVLLLFAGLMQKTFRSTDLLFRFGGEEFIIVLPHTSEKDAFESFERFRAKLENFVFPQVRQVTTSIGFVKIEADEHISNLLEMADKALYFAKDHGRNQVCNYHELIAEGLIEQRQLGGDIELF
jgi:diguanylate cyclase (GGDEF)-like protein